MTIRRWLVTGVAVGAMSLPLFAKEGIVKTRDGTSYQGDVTETDDGKVVVKVHGIDMRIDRHDIESVKYIDDAGVDFQKKLAALNPKDAQGRIDLAKASMQQKQYDQARQAAQSALDIDPNSAEASSLLNMIRRQQALDRAPKITDVKPVAGSDPLIPDAPITAVPATSPVDQKFLSADEVNSIKQKELGPQESEFKATFNNDVRRKFVLKDNNGTLAEFTDLASWKQARYILDRTPELSNDVRIMTDPASIASFKAHVQPAILAGCATAACHGGANAGKVVLYTPATNDAVTYTNFYILSQYVKTIGKTQIAMIDRNAPQNSLILQYALPAEVADYKHPDVQNYKGVFRTGGDPRYIAIRDWITKALLPVAPDYQIKYAIPGAPTTKPSGK